MSDQASGEPLRHGDGPDPRFSLANEHTALALVAAGIAVISISSLGVVPWTALIGAVCFLGGAVLAWLAVAGWERAECALRMKKRLPW